MRPASSPGTVVRPPWAYIDRRSPIVAVVLMLVVLERPVDDAPFADLPQLPRSFLKTPLMLWDEAGEHAKPGQLLQQRRSQGDAAEDDSSSRRRGLPVTHGAGDGMITVSQACLCILTCTC